MGASLLSKMSLNVITVKLSWGILVLADFRPMRYRLSCCGSQGKNLLFKSVLGHCYIWKKNNHPSSKPSKSNLFAFMNQFCWWIKILCTLIMLWNPTNFEAIFLLKICSRLAILLWICDDFTSLENLTEDGVFPYITVVSI